MNDCINNGDLILYPYFTNFQITRKCNLNCMHCGFDAGIERVDELTTEEIINTINELYYLNCQKIQLTGGEPLLRKDVFEIASYAVSLGIEISLLSNGFYITKEVAQKIKKSGITSVGISIDGLKNSHNRFRRNDNAFESAKDALIHIVNEGIETNVLTTVNKLCLEELEELYDFMIQIGITNWILQTTANVGRMKNNSAFALEPFDMLTIEQFIVDKKKLNGVKIIAGDSIGYHSDLEIMIRENKSFSGCYAGMFQIGILSDGGIIGCLALPHIQKFIEGNLRERSLSSIWFDNKSFSYNRDFLQTDLEGFCSECKFGDICKAGCKTNAYGATGSLFNNPYCTYRIKNNNI